MYVWHEDKWTVAGVQYVGLWTHSGNCSNCRGACFSDVEINVEQYSKSAVQIWEYIVSTACSRGRLQPCDKAMCWKYDFLWDQNAEVMFNF